MAEAIEIPPDENRGPEILAVCGSLVGFSLVIVLLRLYVRAKMVRHVGVDDWIIVTAMMVMFVEMMVIIPEVQLGAGRHVQYIKPPENVTKGLHLNFVTQPLCLIGLCLTKVSVGFFLLRLSTSRRLRWIVIGTMIFTVLSATGNFLTVFFQCRPLALTWDTSVEGTCIPPSHLKFAAFFNSSVAALTDVIFALLPVPLLWKVQMNWKVKSAVTTILSLGIFAAVSAIVKITFLGAYGQHGDFLWDSADITIWTTVEINIAIVAASIPCLKPLFKTLLEGSSAARRYYGASNLKGAYSDQTPRKLGTSSAATSSAARRSRWSAAVASTAPEFEMYGPAGKFAADIKTGVSAAGSEESILPQEVDQEHATVPTAGAVTTTTKTVTTPVGPHVEGITKTSTVMVQYDEEERRRSVAWEA